MGAQDRQEWLDTVGDSKQHWPRQPSKTSLLQGTTQSLSFAVPSSGQQGQAELQAVRRSPVTSTTWASFSHLLRTFCMSWKTCCRTTTTCKEREGLKRIGHHGTGEGRFKTKHCLDSNLQAPLPPPPYEAGQVSSLLKQPGTAHSWQAAPGLSSRAVPSQEGCCR